MCIFFPRPVLPAVTLPNGAMVPIGGVTARNSLYVVDRYGRSQPAGCRASTYSEGWSRSDSVI